MKIPLIMIMALGTSAYADDDKKYLQNLTVCVYEDKHYSQGATVCMPSVSAAVFNNSLKSESPYDSFECIQRNGKTRWVANRNQLPSCLIKDRSADAKPIED